MSFHDAIQEVLSISEEKLNSGDYFTISNHLKTIYETFAAKTPDKQHQVIQSHIIRKYDRVLSEDDQLNKQISFALTIEEQVLVMRDRYRRYYETEIAELAETIASMTILLKETRELKQDLYAEYKYTRGEDDKSAHKSACMRERNLNADLMELKVRHTRMKQKMEIDLNPPLDAR